MNQTGEGREPKLDILSWMGSLCANYVLFGRQIRQGIANNTKGTAFVVYEDVMDAKTACDKLNGFNFQNRYLVGELCLTCLEIKLWRERLAGVANYGFVCSIIPSTRENGPTRTRFSPTAGESRKAQKATWY